jgi:hypothetical protein
MFLAVLARWFVRLFLQRTFLFLDPANCTRDVLSVWTVHDFVDGYARSFVFFGWQSVADVLVFCASFADAFFWIVQE